MITLYDVLAVAGLLFCIGAYGVVAKKNAIAVMIGIEFMLNAVNINLIAFNQFLSIGQDLGLVFAVFIIGIAAAEVSLALAIILSLYRQRKSVLVDELDILKW